MTPTCGVLAAAAAVSAGVALSTVVWTSGTMAVCPALSNVA